MGGAFWNRYNWPGAVGICAFPAFPFFVCFGWELKRKLIISFHLPHPNLEDNSEVLNAQKIHGTVDKYL